MADAWLPLTLGAAAFAAVGLYLFTRRPSQPIAYADPREERLTRKLAQTVGCSLAQALPAVRREIDLAPAQSDETLLKRAAYHYRQELPEAPCRVYQDKVKG
jgi:hypothetical protein